MSSKREPTVDLGSDGGCRFSAENLHLFLEGEADPLTGRAVEAHLRGCESCRREWRELERERIAFLEAAVVSPSLSPSFASRVIGEIRRTESERRTRLKLSVFRRAAILVAAAAAIVIAGAVAFQVVSSGPASGSRQPGVVVAQFRKAAAREEAPHPAAPVPVIPVHCEEIPPPLPESREGGTLRFADWFDLSLEMLPSTRRPCFRDLNHDGKDDGSDAAHLFMLAVQTLPPEFTRPLEEEIEAKCLSSCLNG